MAKKNDIFIVKDSGAKAKLVRESSYAYTLEFIEAKGPYRKGDKINLSKYEAQYFCAANSYNPNKT